MDVMESKETIYRPLMAPSDFADDDSQTSMSDHASLLRKKPAWRQYIPSLNRFLLLFNMMLMTVAIVMVATWEPTEKQCTRRLSMWCKFHLLSYHRFSLGDNEKSCLRCGSLLTIQPSSHSACTRSSRIRRRRFRRLIQFDEHLPWTTHSRERRSMG